MSRSYQDDSFLRLAKFIAVSHKNVKIKFHQLISTAYINLKYIFQ